VLVPAHDTTSSNDPGSDRYPRVIQKRAMEYNFISLPFITLIKILLYAHINSPFVFYQQFSFISLFNDVLPSNATMILKN